MASWTFTPTHDPMTAPTVPYFEDARADFAPYYRSRKTIKQAKQDVTTNLGLLGAALIEFREGTFEINQQSRKGYEVVFNWVGNMGVMRVAGLPMHSRTAVKEDQVKIQALLNLADWLKASITQRTFSPGDTPLLPFLLVDGKRTLAEALAGGKSLPLLGSGS